MQIVTKYFLEYSATQGRGQIPYTPSAGRRVGANKGKGLQLQFTVEDKEVFVLRGRMAAGLAQTRTFVLHSTTLSSADQDSSRQESRPIHSYSRCLRT